MGHWLMVAIILPGVMAEKTICWESSIFVSLTFPVIVHGQRKSISRSGEIGMAHETHWFSNVVASMEEEGAAAIAAKINAENVSIEDIESIRAQISESDGSLDDVSVILQAVVDAALTLADIAADDQREVITQYANVTSYNLAADLADCWPGDQSSRSPGNFEAGLYAANTCIRLREEMQKPPQAFAMAYFIKGVHEYSLGDRSAALASFCKQLDFEHKASGVKKSELPGPELASNLLCAHGLIALVKFGLGDDQAEKEYEKIQDHLSARAKSVPEDKENCDLYLGELQALREKHGP
jgi:hypothetical protein